MTISRATFLALSGTLLLTAAADPPLPTVPAQAETAPVTSRTGDTADDPAIWRDPEHPERSLIISTDKKAGLAIHDLRGRLLRFQPLGKLNNVDLRSGIAVAGKTVTLVAASDRSDKKRPVLQLFQLDPQAPMLVPIGSLAMAEGEAYGLCLYRHGDRADAIMVYEEGVVEQVALDLSGLVPQGRSVHRFELGSRSEGCVVDDRTGQLYVAEDKVAIWRFHLGPDGPTAAIKFADVDGLRLHKDTEGLAILPRGREGGLLFASSQGNDSFAAFRLPGGTFAGAFRIAGGVIGGAEDTDGIALQPGDFGPSYPGGLCVAQDGKIRDPNARGKPARAPQNFKLAPLEAVLRALGEPR
jgi:3-phytase